MARRFCFKGGALNYARTVVAALYTSASTRGNVKPFTRTKEEPRGPLQWDTEWGKAQRKKRKRIPLKRNSKGFAALVDPSRTRGHKMGVCRAWSK